MKSTKLFGKKQAENEFNIPDADMKEPQTLKKGGKAHKADGDKPRARLDKRARGGYVPKKDFHPGGEKGKLHRELGVSEDKKIPADRLAKAAHSSDPEIKRDAIRAETMKKWKH